MLVTVVRDHLVRVYRAGSRSTRLLVGNPGIGKTAVVKQAAEALGIEYRSWPATVLDPLDIGGLPAVVTGEDKKIHALRLPFADLIPAAGNGLLVFEDLTTAPPLTQASLYSLTWDRHVGSFALGDGWMVVCTANPPGSGAATNRMPTPLVNRMEHLFVEADFKAWEQLMAVRERNSIVRAFLHCSPQAFVDFDPLRPGPFPTARSWEECAALFDQYAPDVPPEPAIAGWVGSAVALQLIAFAQANALLVSPDEIFADPKHAPIPEGLSAKVVLMTALAGRVRYETAPSFFAYLRRRPIGEEMGIYATRLGLHADAERAKRAGAGYREIASHESYQQFAEDRADLFTVATRRT